MFKENGNVENNVASREELEQQEDAKRTVAEIENGKTSSGFEHFIDKHPAIKRMMRAVVLTGALSGIPSSSHSPKSVERVMNPMIAEQTKEDDSRYIEQAKSDPAIFFIIGYTNINNPKQQDELLHMAALRLIKINPKLIVSSVSEFSNRPWFKEVFEQAVEKDPVAAIFNLLTMDENIMDETEARKPKVLEFYSKFNNPVIKKILEITSYDTEVIPGKDRTFLKKDVVSLLEKIIHNGLSVDDAVSIVCDDTKFFHALLEIQNTTNHIGEESVNYSMKYVVLRLVQKINNLHEQSDEIRFKGIENISSKEIYSLIAQGEEEIFTSTFNGLFDRMLAKMQAEHLSGDTLLQGGEKNSFRTFLKLCSEYNRLGDFLETMSPEARQTVLENFVQGISGEKDEALSQISAVAESVTSLRDPAILKVLDQKIKAEYERAEKANDTQGKLLYGLLASSASENSQTDQEWFAQMKTKYNLPSINEVPESELFDAEERSIQQYFFYNDQDGENSFKSFMANYEGKAGWKIEKHENYVHIGSRGNGKKIEIYANYPKTDTAGIEEVGGILQSEGKQPQIIVHRGHSYHVQNTIDHIPKSARIVVLGSCGGYRNLDGVLEKSPETSILSTKGTGTMQVNDPLLQMLNHDIQKGKGIVWKDFWAGAEKHLGKNENFKNYVSPEKNLGASIIRAYNQLSEKNFDNSSNPDNIVL